MLETMSQTINDACGVRKKPEDIKIKHAKAPILSYIFGN